MADKKLNEVSQLTDFDYALVVKGNGMAIVTGKQEDRKSTRLNSSHSGESRMPSSA